LHKSFIGIFFIEFWYWITRPLLNFFKLINYNFILKGLPIIKKYL
jgi:hypothetical protein